MIGAVCPDLERSALEALTVGERDRRLLELRAALFGSQLACRSTCPDCGEAVEMAVETSQLCGPMQGAQKTTESVVHATGCDVRFRVPTTGDLAAAVQTADVATMRGVLLERCVLSAARDGASLAVSDLPETTVMRVVEAMAEADPQADIQLALTCPHCGVEWGETFDIVIFLWSEVNDWAERTLHEIHTLASAYGWTEAQILALSPRRRARYLEMIES